MVDQPDRLEAGKALRREVLGSDYVDRRAATSWAFAKPFSDFLTEFVWGSIWTRPGLGRRDRSLVNLGMLVALNRSDELKIHIEAALTNGVTPDEIREVFMQTAVYCGAPAALEAFRCARGVFADAGVAVDEGA